jgi:hypothetical protein
VRFRNYGELVRFRNYGELVRFRNYGAPPHAAGCTFPLLVFKDLLQRTYYSVFEDKKTKFFS